ncbi:MAG: class IV adenylate cyclase [Pseudonocardiaceae bacterium]
MIALDETLFVSAFGQDAEGRTSPMYQICSTAYGGSLYGGFRRFSVSCNAPRGGSFKADRVGIETELKTRVHDIDRVRGLLRQRAAEQNSMYADSYFDTPDLALTHNGCELRVREVHTDDDAAVTLLTYKGAPVHAASRSKPETETTVGDADALRAVLAALGFEVLIAFEKRCSNYRFTAAGQPLLATLVYVPELEETFLEIETIVDFETDVGPALEVIRQVMGQLELDRNDETTEAYTEAVAAHRNKP